MAGVTLDLGIDIDNVLYPFATVISRWAERRKGLAPGTLDDHALSWTWYRDQWGMDDEEFKDHFRSGVQAGVIFAQGDPTPGSVAAMRRLHVAGHRLHYITDRLIAGDAAFDVTHTWLHDAGFPVDSITISADKSIVRTDVFLDDAPHNIQALRDAGHPLPLIWDRPHNRGGVITGPRVFDWHQFEAVVAVHEPRAIAA